MIRHLKEEPELLWQFLTSFSCSEDKDIEFFLHHRAVDFENLSKSRTYLICNEAELQLHSLNHVTIYGYISIALKILTIPNETSNRIKKPERKVFTLTPFWLFSFKLFSYYNLFISSSRSFSYPGFPRRANIFFLYASTPGWLNGFTPRIYPLTPQANSKK